MVRSILVLRAALLLAGVSDARATHYAPILREEGARRGLDPLAIVALVEGESHWNPDVEGGVGGQCIGLGQLCLHAIPACRGQGRGSDQCAAERRALLDADTNLRRTFASAAAWRRRCARFVHGRVTPRHWLIGYQGYDKGCGARTRATPATTLAILLRYEQFRALRFSRR